MQRMYKIFRQRVEDTECTFTLERRKKGVVEGNVIVEENAKSRGN